MQKSSRSTKRFFKYNRFLLASSGNVFGRPIYLPIDEKHPLSPHNPYATLKACQEMLALAYYRAYGVPLVVIDLGGEIHYRSPVAKILVENDNAVGIRLADH